jgi:hypothetical protein
VLRLVPVVALAVALVAAGCGNDNRSSNDYVDAVNKAQNEFAATFDKLSGQITANSTPSQDRKTLDGFKDAVDKVVVQLRAIDVPSKVRVQHQQLIDEISSYGDEIDKARRGFQSESPQAIVRAQSRLVSAVTRVSGQINKTIDEINKRLRE